jgi:hypothetical protein
VALTLTTSAGISGATNESILNNIVNGGSTGVYIQRVEAAA